MLVAREPVTGRTTITAIVEDDSIVSFLTPKLERPGAYTVTVEFKPGEEVRAIVTFVEELPDG